VSRVILIVLDSVGIGEMPDSYKYGDNGSNTLVNTARAVGGLELPNLAWLGLGKIAEIPGIPTVPRAAGAFGKMAERSSGKDTTTGHWELAGIILEKPFPLYPAGFPPEIIKAFERSIGRRILGNKAASGTAIIEELGAEHLRTGSPIVYTSADSVFQIAAHEDVIPVDELYRFCNIARDLLVGKHAVGRVIARPFTGKPGSFRRTPRRHDFSLKPPDKTLLDFLVEKEIMVMAVGKIFDIFAGQGITLSASTRNNMEAVDEVLEFMSSQNKGFIFANLVDFDMLYGHRNDPFGYAQALRYFDNRLPELIENLKPDEILIITADHGCDPTTVSTDHSREYVPLIIYGKQVKADSNLGIRDTFADVAATLAEIFSVSSPSGTSFAGEIL